MTITHTLSELIGIYANWYILIGIYVTLHTVF